MASGRDDFEWELFGPDHQATAGFHLVRKLAEFATSHFAEIADLFPFRMSWACETHVDENWWLIRLSDALGFEFPKTGTVTDEILIEAARGVAAAKAFPEFGDIIDGLPAGSITHRCFVYVGPKRGKFASHNHVITCFEAWVRSEVLPVIERWNQDRVLRALPEPPSYDVERILSAVFVMESDSTSQQGTCFHLRGVGLVTCDHVVAEDSKTFRASEPQKRFPVAAHKRNPTIDLAVLEIPDGIKSLGLYRARGESPEHMSHVAVVGFPNFRHGDSGILSPGLVVGFRTVSAIRRLLVNSAIVAGTSGGPVLDGSGSVIGIAVTGADRPSTVSETENHGVIPVDALDLL